MGRVVHFELYGEDPARAVEFYRRVFGWKIVEMEGLPDYWLVTTGEGTTGINGGIGRRTSGETCNVVVEVDSIEDTTVKTLAAGGRVVSPKMAVPGVGWAAYYEDSEGVMFGVMQSDPAAK